MLEILPFVWGLMLLSAIINSAKPQKEEKKPSEEEKLAKSLTEILSYLKQS